MTPTPRILIPKNSKGLFEIEFYSNLYMFVKLPPRDLNSGTYHPHLTNTYICGVTIVPRVRGGPLNSFFFFFGLRNRSLI